MPRDRIAGSEHCLIGRMPTHAIEWRNVLPKRHSKGRIARVEKSTRIVVIAAPALRVEVALNDGTYTRLWDALRSAQASINRDGGVNTTGLR